MRSTPELRALYASMPTARIKMHLRWTRQTIRQPPYLGRHLVNGKQGPDYVFCARTAAIMRAELTRRTNAARCDHRA